MKKFLATVAAIGVLGAALPMEASAQTPPKPIAVKPAAVKPAADMVVAPKPVLAKPIPAKPVATPVAAAKKIVATKALAKKRFAMRTHRKVHVAKTRSRKFVAKNVKPKTMVRATTKRTKKHA